MHSVNDKALQGLTLKNLHWAVYSSQGSVCINSLNVTPTVKELRLLMPSDK
jgi:hypothetical protein